MSGNSDDSEEPSAPLLKGLRVVELGDTECAARVGQFLADHGATVTLVERPGGSSLRSLPGWVALGRGKHSTELDLNQEQGKTALMELVSTADVVINSMRPTAIEALGLTYNELSTTNPRIVVASITGFGTRGPFAGLKGYEGVVMAKLGVYSSFARATRRSGPTFVTPPYASYCAAQLAIQGVLAALLERERSGLGQQVDANMTQSLATLDCWMWFLRIVAERYPDAFKQVPAFDDEGNPNAHQVLTLLVAATSDERWLQFSQLQPHLFAAFLRSLEMADLMEEPGWEGLPIYDQAEKRGEVWRRLLEGVNRWSLAEWEHKFDEDPNVFAELFRSGQEVLDHPALADSPWVVTSEDPAVGAVRHLGRTVRVEGEAWMPGPTPNLGGTTLGPLDPRWTPTAGDASTVGSRPPLEGTTILDLCVWYAAPYATALLADLGARVIHVEPLEGDPIRVAAGFPEVGALKVTQGKESLAVDLSTPEGRDIVRELARRCSAILHGFRTGVAEKLGLDYVTLRALNPDLVYVDATGYGTGGPYAHRPSYAPSIAAAAGLTMRTIENHLGTEPVRTLDERKERARRLSAGTSSPTINADGLSAIGTANALMLGLLSAARGTPSRLETTMLSTAASVNFEALLDHAGVQPNQADPDLLGFSALYRLYETADGWVFLAVTKDREWAALVDALGPETQLRLDPRFATSSARADHDGELAELLEGVFRRRSAEDWEKDLTVQDIACVVSSEGSTEAMLMSREIGESSGYVAHVNHPTFDKHARLAPVLRFSRSATLSKPGCLAGQHTDAILSELGMDSARIEDLKARRVVA